MNPLSPPDLGAAPGACRDLARSAERVTRLDRALAGVCATASAPPTLLDQPLLGATLCGGRSTIPPPAEVGRERAPRGAPTPVARAMPEHRAGADRPEAAAEVTGRPVPGARVPAPRATGVGAPAPARRARCVPADLPPEPPTAPTAGGPDVPGRYRPAARPGGRAARAIRPTAVAVAAAPGLPEATSRRARSTGRASPSPTRRTEAAAVPAASGAVRADGGDDPPARHRRPPRARRHAPTGPACAVRSARPVRPWRRTPRGSAGPPRGCGQAGSEASRRHRAPGLRPPCPADRAGRGGRAAARPAGTARSRNARRSRRPSHRDGADRRTTAARTARPREGVERRRPARQVWPTTCGAMRPTVRIQTARGTRRLR